MCFLKLKKMDVIIIKLAIRSFGTFQKKKKKKD